MEMVDFESSPGEEDNLAGENLNQHKNYYEKCGKHGNLETSVKRSGKENDRGKWRRPLEFLLSCVSISVGLGNVWRFPSTAYQNGGGAFLIPYVICLVLIGRPLYFLELAIGQFSSSANIKVWKVVPAVKGIGYAQTMMNWLILTYYSTVMCISLFYLIQSMQASLPWTLCDPSWATSNCVDSTMSLEAFNQSNMQSSAEQYFNNFVIQQAPNLDGDLGLPDWRMCLCLLAIWIFLFAALFKGVKSLGMISYLTSVVPLVLLITLLICSLMLPGSQDGILYFLRPSWSKLLQPMVWYNALTQSFFSLGIGSGAIMMLGSYNDYRHNIYRDACILSIVDTLTALIAGFTVFSVLGHLAHNLDTDISTVVQSGPHLAFITYPEVLSNFGPFPQVVCVLFFLMLFSLGVGTVLGDTGAVVTVVCDQFPRLPRSLVTLAICIITFLAGLIYITPGGQWILELVDFFAGGFIRIILIIIEVTAISWIYGVNNFISDVNLMLKRNLSWFWKVCWGVVSPLGLIIILVHSLAYFSLPTINGQNYPHAAIVCGWMLSIGVLSPVFIGFIHAIYISQGVSWIQKLKSTFQPKASWGPQNINHRHEWEIHNQSSEMTS